MFLSRFALLILDLSSEAATRGVSDHFPIFLIFSEKILENTKHITIQKRVINDQSILYFKEILHEVDWTHFYTLSNPNQAYSYFLRIFSAIYDHAFPVKEMKIKRIVLLNPWMSKGLQKSSKKKKKKKLYDKFLKNRTDQNKKRYKDYKSLFEILKEKSKKLFYKKKLADWENNVKKTWDTIKEVIGKAKLIDNGLPKMKVIDECEIFDQNKIAHSFNKFFTSIGPKLASSIPSSSKDFKDFLSPVSANLDEYPLHDEELNEAFNSLKANKSPGFDDISPTVVKRCHEDIFNPIKHVFSLTLKQGVFAEKLKIARVSLIFKKDEKFLFNNYRPISATMLL